MASLVADYDSSSNSGEDSEKDDELLKRSGAVEKNTSSFFSVTEETDKSPEEEIDNTSVCSYGQKSQSIHCNLKGKQTSVKPDNKLPNPLASDARLPAPSFGQQDSERSQPLSVFTNPYQKEEEARQSILEQHVKLSATEMQQAAQGKKVCRLFLAKGKCRFGASCKYSHGNDVSKKAKQEIQASQENADGGHSGQEGTPAYPSMQAGYQGGPLPVSHGNQQKNHAHSQYGYQSFHAAQEDFVERQDDDSYMASAKRKRRVGVSDSLVPPKKAMQAFSKFRKEERPWTVHKE